VRAPIYFVSVPRPPSHVSDLGIVLERALVVIVSIYAVFVLFSWLFTT
jgi:hypothetical protein